MAGVAVVVSVAGIALESVAVGSPPPTEPARAGDARADDTLFDDGHRVDDVDVVPDHCSSHLDDRDDYGAAAGAFDPAAAIRVVNQSVMCMMSSLTSPAWTWPGQRTMYGRGQGAVRRRHAEQQASG